MPYRRIVITFLIFQTILLAGIAWHTALNRTEVGHVGAAVYLYETFRFDVFHVNPPLSRYFAGLPIKLTTPEYDWKSYSPRPQDRSEWQIGTAFINANPPEKTRWCVFLARCALIPLILLGSYFGYKFASELYGNPAGVIFLTLWTFSPLVLGWGATLCPDVVAASLGIVAVYFLWHWLKKPTWWNAITSGVTLGLLPLAKITWIIAVPIWIIIWLVWGTTESCFLRNTAKQCLAIFLIAIYVLNMGYGFDGTFRQLRDYSFISHTLTGEEIADTVRTPKSGNRFAESLLGYIPVPLPAEFVQGIDTQKLDFERGIESYFLGEYSQHGWLGYYAYVLLVKEPIAVWVLALLAIFATCFVRNSSWRDEFVLIFTGLIFFVFVSSQTGFSVHPRYIIPTLPFLYLWISKLGKTFSEGNRLAASTTTFLLIWLVTSSLLWYPHSMSYCNEIVRSPWHGRHFTDENPPPLLGSNLDWGQNTYFLKNWYEKHSECRPLYVAYASTESFDRLNMNTETVPSVLKSGYYALGLNELFDSSNQYEKFRSMTPIAIIGYTIYIYHITSP